MKCGKCGSVMRIDGKYSAKDGIYTRYRLCQKCNDRIATVEIPKKDYDRLIKPEKIKELIDRLNADQKGGAVI